MTVALNLVSRAARHLQALHAGAGSLAQAAAFARSTWRDDDGLPAQLEKAAVTAHTSAEPLTSVGDRQFLLALTPRTVLGKFGQNGVPDLRRVPFNVPLITELGAGVGYWVGFGKGKPITRLQFAGGSLVPLVIASVAALPDELLRFIGAIGEAAIQNLLVATHSRVMDRDFADPTVTAIADARPASITNGAPSFASSGDPTADVGALVAAVAEDLSLDDAVLLMSPDVAVAIAGLTGSQTISARGGTFAGLPVVTSRALGDTVALVHASLIAVADEGQVSVDLSASATLEMTDAPVGDSVTPSPVELVSMYQSNTVAARVLRRINWLRMRTDAVRLVTGVSYGFGS